MTFAAGSTKGRGGAAMTASSTNALDDPNLLSNLVKSAKSAHSTLGRALDTTLSHQRFGGAEMEPSALTMNRLERQRQLRLQQELQRACGDTSVKSHSSTYGGRPGKDATTKGSAHLSTAGKVETLREVGAVGTLHIPALPTMAPSMTAAADDGTESLGGTKIGGADRGYVTLISAVPTFATTRQIEDNYELISSFRAYRSDAQRVERQSALRDVSAPHPDLLEQLTPLLQQQQQQQRGGVGAVSAQPMLVDVETLPYNLRQAYAAQQQQRQLQASAGLSDANALEDNEGAEKQAEEKDGPTADGTAGAAESVAPAAAVSNGTWAFTCQGRAAADRVKSLNYLPGQRQPVVGQYYVRYGMVEPRVTGGYVTPQAPVQYVAPTAAGLAAVRAVAAEAVDAERRPETSNMGDGERITGGANHNNTGDAASVFGQTLRDDVASVVNGGRHGTERSGGDDASNAPPHATLSPGENVKGSSMFLSQVPRQASHGTAAPDVSYWPYPAVRSTTKRPTCLVQLDVPQTQRRREPLVSGVPASVYDVRDDIALHQPRTVTMDRTTGRGTHWYGRTSPTSNGEPLDVDQALLATQPKGRTATLPPRLPPHPNELASTAPSGGPQAYVPDTSVSVERNLDYPPPLMGDAATLSHVRDFGKVPSRAKREARAQLGLTVAYDGDDRGAGPSPLYGDTSAEDAAAAQAATTARSRAALIHPSAPGHQDLHTTSATELGDVPSLALTKPRVGCVTDLGKGSARPAHMAPLHDLTYDADRGYALTGGRVKGTPSIGRTVNRQQAGRTYTEGCGAKVMYNPTDYLAPPVKSVPDFEKQITKEHEFRGHRVQSERYTRLFPAAPGPGHYSVNFSQVE